MAQCSITKTFFRLGVLLALVPLTGCELDSWFNPSVTGYWEATPTTVPILERLDAIEPDDDPWGQTSEAGPDDLIPSDLTYRMAPGDFVTVEIFELYAPNVWSNSTRRIDAAGIFRVPELGNVQAAGLTAQEFEDVLTNLLNERIIVDPQVDVVIQEGSGFNYTVYGATPSPGLYTLRNADLRLMQAIAVAGGASRVTDHVYVIRQVELSDEVRPSFERNPTVVPSNNFPSNADPVDIDSLIDQLDNDGVSPGILRQDGEPTIDIDDLEPSRPDQPAVDIDRLGGAPRSGGTWVYVEERGEWVRVSDPRGAGAPLPGPRGQTPLYLERVIKIPYDALIRGESRYNIVVRPNDRIYIEPPDASGVVYVGGQINRPGVYNLPIEGELTLSRLVDAAGGLNGLAIPERVDLVRRVGENREAVVRLNLSAIRQRTEPDVLIKADDHIIIGTSFWATPLAIVRNGFRSTYGFGFLLDRNFGNDVFGAPPVNNVN